MGGCHSLISPEEETVEPERTMREQKCPPTTGMASIMKAEQIRYGNGKERGYKRRQGPDYRGFHSLGRTWNFIPKVVVYKQGELGHDTRHERIPVVTMYKRMGVREGKAGNGEESTNYHMVQTGSHGDFRLGGKEEKGRSGTLSYFYEFIMPEVGSEG